MMSFRSLVTRALGPAVVTGALTVWFVSEPESKLVVAAVEIPEGSTITIAMLEVREVPTRFFSRRKLGVSSVAGVMGQEAPHLVRAGDFIDPTHFGDRPDVCVLDTRRLGPQFGVEGAALEEFVKRLSPTR
ncbi:MAG: hypothetical protein JNJ54_06685 [Myxococcaceae bacterium]|nr:hypothetical protein [Myxococcaceae bacterium]